MFRKILAVLVLLYAAAAFAAVDVNKAGAAELDGVKGIGPTTSQLILAERKKGDFKNWDDFITRVKGVGQKRASALSANGLTVAGTSYAGAAQADPKPASEKVKDGTREVIEKTKEVGRKVADKTEEVAKKTKDAVTGK